MNSNIAPDLSKIADRYRTLAARFSDLVSAVPADAWGLASRCEGWSALDIVNHVVSTEADLLSRMPFAQSDGIDMADVLQAWPMVRDRVQAALDNSEFAGHTYDGFFGPTTFSATVDQFYSFDLVVHTWDIAKATGMTAYEAIDPGEIATINTAMAGLGDNLRMPGVLGPALEVGPDADEQTAFLAFLGRKA